MKTLTTPYYPEEVFRVTRDNSNGTAGSQAKGILEYAYGHHFCNCLNVDTSGYKRSNTIEPDSFEQLLGIEITVEPNPVNDWTSFNCTLPDMDSKGEIIISDVSGTLVQKFIVSAMQGNQIWDTREIKPGVYFYTLVVKGIGKTSKLVVTK